MLENIPIIPATKLGALTNLTLFTTIIVIYSIFIFYFYKLLAKKNIIKLNLNQYNQYSSPTFTKILAVIFYIIEYLILLPVLTLFWFAILSILVLTLSQGIGTATVLLISAALVAAVRITAYISEDLSKDLAKMLPFTLIAIAITKPGFFEISSLIARINEIPALFSSILIYLIFIFSIELIMRAADFFCSIFSFSRNEEESS